MHDEALDGERGRGRPAPGQAPAPRLLCKACAALHCERWRLVIEAGVERCRSCTDAPGRAPPGHDAHGWHQDGALHIGFGTPRPDQALLRMLTGWIALTPCGGDAPGLEVLRAPSPGLLPVPELDPSRVKERHARDDSWRPVMQPGDLLMFSGDTLHRTHVAPAMTRHRTSLELRFVDGRDSSLQLRGERLVTFDAS